MATNQTTEATRSEAKKTSAKLGKYSMSAEAYELALTRYLQSLPPIPRQVRKSEPRS
jgi:hypothetical protein